MKPTFFIRLAFLTALIITGASSRLHASAAGSDSFATARVINTGRDTSDLTNLTNYTSEPGEAVFDGPGAMGKTAWWKWTAPEDGFCTVDTMETLYAGNPLRDTIVAVYTGTAVNNLTLVGGNSNISGYGPEWLHASVTFYATKGITYYFAADIWGGNPPTATAFNIVLEMRHIPRRPSMRFTAWHGDTSNFNLGTLTMNLTATGTYSGKLVIFKTAYAFKGILGVDGRGCIIIQPKAPAGAIVPPVKIDYDVSGPGSFQIHSGAYTGGRASFPERRIFTEANPMAAYYTGFIISTFQPYGFVSFTVKPNGTVSGRGFNLDGAAFTFSTFLGTSHIGILSSLSIYGVTAGGKSVFSMRGRLQPVNDVYHFYEDYATTCRLPATRVTDPFYNVGFYNSCTVIGSVYNKPVGKQRPMDFLDFSNGSAEIRLPDFQATYGGDITELLTWSDANKLTFASPLRKPALSFNPTTGLLTGSIIIPPDNKKRTIKGMLVRNEEILGLRGFISHTTRNLRFSLHSAAPPPAP